MEEGTLAFCREALFTDKSGFAAVGVHADKNATVAVDTIRAVLYRFTHFQQMI